MSKEALNSLLKYEWSMGNGQCHLCYGLGKGFYPQNAYEEIGHKKTCGIGLAIREFGGDTYFKGELKTDSNEPTRIAQVKYWKDMFDKIKGV